jgi:hypothetical protein
VAGIYEDMRARALAVTADDLGVDRQDAAVFGVLMDMAYPEGAATLIGLADGTTSLYHSGGGGIIGGGEHAHIAALTRTWVAAGAEVVDALEPADDCPLPAAGLVQFVLLTPEGKRAATAPEEELGAGGHELSRLFYAGHDVITELRLIDESRG